MKFPLDFFLITCPQRRTLTNGSDVSTSFRGVPCEAILLTRREPWGACKKQLAQDSESYGQRFEELMTTDSTNLLCMIEKPDSKMFSTSLIFQGNVLWGVKGRQLPSLEVNVCVRNFDPPYATFSVGGFKPSSPSLPPPSPSLLLHPSLLPRPPSPSSSSPTTSPFPSPDPTAHLPCNHRPCTPGGTRTCIPRRRTPSDSWTCCRYTGCFGRETGHKVKRVLVQRRKVYPGLQRSLALGELGTKFSAGGRWPGANVRVEKKSPFVLHVIKKSGPMCSSVQYAP